MIHLVPTFQDNYIFVFEYNGKAMVVDPGDAAPVLDFLSASGLDLALIVATHHHADHTGGIATLKAHFSHARVFSPPSLSELGISCDRVLFEGDSFQFADREWRTLYLPGHTLDHLGYYAHGAGAKADPAPILFCGDVLFSFGCGRLFEGTFAQMFMSLTKLKKLPPDTRIYCAHEYTIRNLDFTIEYLRKKPDDPALLNCLKLRRQLAEKRIAGQPTIPTTIELEQNNNLLFRAGTLEEFTAVRIARNAW